MLFEFSVYSLKCSVISVPLILSPVQLLCNKSIFLQSITIFKLCKYPCLPVCGLSNKPANHSS